MEEEGKTGIPIATGGGETKASSSSSSGSSSYSPLSSLEALLADAQGSELFEEYLESEGLLQQLHFLFAVDGLKTTVSNSEPPQKLAQKIRSISKLVDRLVGLSETTKTQLHEDQIKLPPSANVFDRARDEIEAHMKINLLPNFLKSDIYIHNYIKLQTIIEEGSVSATGPTTTSEVEVADTDLDAKSDGSSSLSRTYSKEKEGTSSSFSSQGASASGISSGAIPAPLKLTSGALAATRRVRLDGTAPPSRLVIHHHPRKGCGSGPVLNPYHASYSSYNPVSRQDSEIQSLSSADGKIATVPGFVRRFDERRGAGASGSSKIRKDNLPKDNLPKIHPTDAASVMRKEIPKFDEKEFTRQLIAKLELVVEERRRDKLESKNRKGAAEELRPHAIASALRKIQCGSQVEAADDILDQHLSRIWSDKTPIRSPPRHGSGQKVKKSNGSSRKKIDTYSVDSGIEFKTPGYEINPLKKASSRQKAGTSTTQEDSGISLVSSSFTQAQHRVAEWQANLPKSSSAHHSLHHQQPPLVSSSSGPAPKKPTTPPRFTILIIYSDSPEAKETYRLSSDVTLTLGQLKQQLPRRGNYRYFFKKVCDELDIVVQEEITRDDAILPQVAAGKIVVTLQPQPQQL